MWRVIVLNLCFVIVLITILALQHSASVFTPIERGYEPLSSDSYGGRFHAESDPAWSRIRFGNGLGTAVRHLSDLWQRSMIMNEWLLEYQTTYWASIDAARGAENDLVEARFHVANAEVFGAAMGEQRRAKIELERAEDYLIKTRPLIDENVRPNLETVEKEIGAAKMHVESMGSGIREPYDRIKTDLDPMIEKLHFTNA